MDDLKIGDTGLLMYAGQILHVKLHNIRQIQNAGPPLYAFFRYTDDATEMPVATHPLHEDCIVVQLDTCRLFFKKRYAMDFNVGETGWLMYDGHILRMEVRETISYIAGTEPNHIEFGYAKDATEKPIDLGDDDDTIMLDISDSKLYFKKDMQWI